MNSVSNSAVLSVPLTHFMLIIPHSICCVKVIAFLVLEYKREHGN